MQHGSLLQSVICLIFTYSSKLVQPSVLVAYMVIEACGAKYFSCEFEATRLLAHTKKRKIREKSTNENDRP